LRRAALPFVLFPGLLPLALAGCSEGYSPNTYASNAAQEEAAVQRGVIIGVRQVTISADGTVGAATGGAAGGVAGAQVPGVPVVTALGAIGGTLVGGIGGSAAEQAVGKTKGWEYIVQEEPGDRLVSVTQTSKVALPVGLRVLVIAGTQQARIVPDYTVQIAAAAPAPKPVVAKPAAAPDGSATVEIDISPVLPPLAPLQAAPASGTP
jgi:outer membrane lipoprotein SlyB